MSFSGLHRALVAHWGAATVKNSPLKWQAALRAAGRCSQDTQITLEVRHSSQFKITAGTKILQTIFLAIDYLFQNKIVTPAQFKCMKRMQIHWCLIYCCSNASCCISCFSTAIHIVYKQFYNRQRQTLLISSRTSGRKISWQLETWHRGRVPPSFLPTLSVHLSITPGEARR